LRRLWFDIDAANGAIRARLDKQQRAYRWLFNGLHRFIFPALANHPALRTCLAVALCGFGFIFSLTDVLMGRRRNVPPQRLPNAPRRLPNVPG